MAAHRAGLPMIASADDTAYVETIPRISTFTTTKRTGWTSLNFASATQVLSVSAGFLVLAENNSRLLVGRMDGLTRVSLPPNLPWMSQFGRIAVDHNSTTLGAVDGTGESLYALTCNFDSVTPTCSPVANVAISPPLGSPSAVVMMAGQLWAGGSGGLVHWRIGSTACAHLLRSERVAAVASRPPRAGSFDAEVAAGSVDKLWLFDVAGGTPILKRFEWTTDVISARGGAIDDAISALEYDAQTSGVLFIGTASALNMRALDGTITRRAGARASDDLPCAKMSSLALTANPLWKSAAAEETGACSASPAQLWIGCDRGLAVADILSSGQPAEGSFRYLNGPRWHPGVRVNDLAALGGSSRSRSRSRSRSSQAGAVPTVVALTDGGVSLLRQELWTLEQKAGHYEAILTRHHRHQLVADCHLSSEGDLTTCAKTSGDNDGLWTALAAGAESLRYAATKNDSAKALAFGFFEGLESLYNITGKAGLMARSLNAPGEPYDPGHHDKTRWHNATAPGYAGYVWKGDTSSDEVTGHFFGYQLVGDLATEAGSSARARVDRLQLTVAIHLVRNAFQLIDVTGKATTWGRWDPSTLNGNRNFSDGRGVNSVQMLAFLASANRTAARLGESQAVELLTDGYQHLVGPAAGYFANALNAKIVAPCDDNFSDDELLMLPTYTHLVGAAAGGGASAKEEVETLRAGLRRSFDVALDKERSALWGSIFLAAGGARSAAEHKAVMSDVLWSLRNCACQGPPLCCTSRPPCLVS
jgi:hypothetical protein